ncbi:hypothetical protein [Pseudooceanicola onchidii]|uniref:hypothetical protein n=1 Tax=Pseudooceanicola onchidii TaxID=2562279 RepID=UPI0010A9DD42|nr:hypothetical protein [Pseudooceanicola onchidii]
MILSLVLVTLVGLGLYALLVRGEANRAFLPMLGPGVVLLAIAGIGILRLLPTDSDAISARTYIALAMLWIGWIGFAALVAQMLMRRMPDLTPVPALTGALATLAPVAGFLVTKTLS